jgi:hypothetical protein
VSADEEQPTDDSTLLDVNCLAAAISILQRRDVNEVIRDIAAAAKPGELSFTDTGCAAVVWRRYLTASRWTRHKRIGRFEDLPPIPQTCLLIYPKHAAALLCGAMFDRSPAAIWGEPILEYWTRPKHGEPE